MNLIPTSPAMKRAVKEAKEALERQGHELVPFELSTEEWTEIQTVLY